MRGGEKVLAEICSLFPDAPLYTHVCVPDKVDPLFKTHPVKESFIARLPGARRGCQKYLPLMPLALKQLDLEGFDLIISSESGPAKGIRKPAGAKHLCYCHTPMRYLYDLHEEYFRRGNWAEKAAMLLFTKYLRRYDQRSAESVDLFLANSNFVAQRIRQVYGRESLVVNPPVETAFFSKTEGIEKKNFYLLAGAFVPYKRPELAIESCLKMGRSLVVAGSGPLEKELRRKYTSPLITFISSPDKETLRHLYASAAAMLFPGIEDFGIMPVECQAAGTPVIACGRGGALETLLPGRTGLFFHEQSIPSLCGAIEEFESRSWESSFCRENAERFAPEHFRRKFRQAVAELLANK